MIVCYQYWLGFEVRTVRVSVAVAAAGVVAGVAGDGGETVAVAVAVGVSVSLLVRMIASLRSADAYASSYEHSEILLFEIPCNR